nr:DMT family transporter [Clostridium polynesiense]
MGLQYTTPSKNAFLTATNVILVPFLYWIVLRRTPDKYSIIGAVLTIIGISFLTLESSSLALSWGDILTLICALGFALHIISIGYYTKKHHPIKLTILQIFTAFILSVSAMLFTRESFSINYKGFISVMYLGAMGTTVTFLLQNVAQKYTNATKAAIILSTEAVFGTLASVIFLGEVLNIKMILGCFIIFTGILIAETKLSFINSKKNLKTEKAG